VRDGLVDHKELRRLAGRFILRTRHLLVNGSRDSRWIVGHTEWSDAGLARFVMLSLSAAGFGSQ
jgi:hypothetical protein